MTFYISFGKFDLKYFFYCLSFLIIQIYIHFVIEEDDEILISVHPFLNSFCFFFFFLLNIIPLWIVNTNSKVKENPIANELKKEENTQYNKYIQSIEYKYFKSNKNDLSRKDLSKIFFISFVILLTEIVDNIISTKDNDKETKKYNDDFIIFEYLFIFLISKYFEEVYYKHHYFSFLILIFVEVIKAIYFFIKNLYQTFNIIVIISQIIYTFLYAIYFISIKRIMKYNFIIPPKCNFLIGVIDVPLILIIYIIISLTPLGNKTNEYYVDNIFELFKNINFDVKNVIHLISLPFIYGLYLFIASNIIYDYTIYHIYFPFLIEYFVENIIKNFGFSVNIFLILIFIIELIMVLIFIEIIEINFCGLNKNIKRNIQSRGIIDSSLIFEDDDDEIDYARNDEDNKIINSKF